MLAVGALLLSSCGSSKKYANDPPQATPRNLTVYINDSRVSVSPATVGAGPVVFEITNQASRAESLSIVAPGGSGSQPLASTGPINPQATAQVAVNFTSAGNYTVATSSGGGGGTDAQLATSPNTIQPATVHIGSSRSGSSGDLLVP